MAYVDYGTSGDTTYDPGSMGGPVNYTDPTPRAADPAQGDPYGTVSGYYQSLLGRAPENTDVVNNWVNGLGGGGSNLAAVYSAIGASPEAQAFKSRAAAPATPTAGGGDWIGSALSAAQSTDDPNYWRSVIGADPKAMAGDPSAIAYWQDRIARGDGALAVRQGTMQKFQDGPAANQYAATGGNPGGYTDPSSQLYLSQLLQRLTQVQQPQDNSIFELLKSLATSTASNLQQPPYTPADEAALITKYRQPLTQARDQAKQQAAVEMSRRGIGPTSGVFQDRMKQIDQAYVGGVAQGANQMGVNAVQLKNDNALKALQILSGLSSANNTQIDRSNAMSDQAVTLAKMFPDFDAQRLQQLLQASGDSGSALQSLMSLGNLNAGIINTNNLADQANSQAWGKLIAAIMGGL